MAKKKILIVEDDRAVAESIKGIIKKMGHSVSGIVTTGDDAINQVNKSSPDLILMDVSLQGKIDGIEVAEKIKERLDIPLVYLTARTDEESLVRAKATAPFGYIVKPFDVQDLRLTVEASLHRSEMEKELRERVERFRQLAENIHEVFWMFDNLKQQMIYLSPAYEETWGRPREDTYKNPQTLMEAVHPEFQGQVAAAYDKQLQGKPTVEEYQIIRPDGTVRWISDRAFPILDATGKVYRVVGIAEDITERKLAEQELERIFDLSLDMICISDTKGNFLRVNPAFETTLGYKTEELLKKSYYDLIHINDLARTATVFKEKLSKGHPLFDFQNRYRCKDGSYKWIEWRSQPPTEDGLLYAIGRDITERKMSEAMKQESEKKHRK